MQAQKITDMTVEELETFINRLVDERIKRLLKTAQPVDYGKLTRVMASIEQHRWTPPTGAPSVVEMLREDRDR
jgi:hypothetical protein